MKKIGTTLLSTALAVSCLAAAGCGGGGKSQAGGAQTLQVYVLESGYGRDWAINTKDAFLQQAWVKEKYPEAKVEITFNDNNGFAAKQMETGSKYNNYDILFGPMTLSNLFGTKDVLDLTDSVYNQKVPGEEILYKDKLNESAMYAFAKENANGEMRQYATPYFIGQYGIIYNETELAKYASEAPRTTNELISLMDKIKEAGQYAFTWGNGAHYWNKEGGIFEVWWAQYEGVQEYDNFFNGIADEQLSVDIFKQEGRRESLEVLETILRKENGYYNPEVTNNVDYVTAQQAFYTGSAVFHYNGDYFIDETKESVSKLKAEGRNPSDVKMMRTPIISEIITKCTTIENDAELSAVVKAIDNGSTSITGDGYDVSQKDFNRVLEARGVVGPVGPAPGIIPSYSDAQELAIDFLRFMATDEGIAQYAKGTSGSTLDFKCDLKTSHPDVYNSLSVLHQERLAYRASENLTINVLRKASTYPLNVYGGVCAIKAIDWHTTFMAGNATKTAADFYNETNNEWDADKFDAALGSAGLK